MAKTPKKNESALKFHPIIQDALDAGICITMSKDTDGQVQYDMNLLAKSSMHCYVVDDERLRVEMRYDESHFVDDFDGLLLLAIHGMHGRTFINHTWAKAITDAGYELPK